MSPTTSTSTTKPFRIVIVGAGVAGLSLSHALQLAGIDHVVLEKHEKPLFNAGALFALLPSTARVFEQFGFLKELDALCTPLKRENCYWPDGRLHFGYEVYMKIGEFFNRDVLITDREHCLSHLYNYLPNKSYIWLGKKVTHIHQDDSGVLVTLADGTTEAGDMLIGADGVHSMVRDYMWEHMLEQQRAAAETVNTSSNHQEDSPNLPLSQSTVSIPDVAAEKKKMVRRWCALFGVSPRPAQLGDSDASVFYGKGYTTLVFTQPDRVFWTVGFWRGAESYVVGEHEEKKRYTAEEIEEVVQRFANVPVEGWEAEEKREGLLKFKSLWDTRWRSNFVDVEEGVLSHWHSGRVVLVGDSIHKMTPDVGLGANLTIEGIVTLTNLLYAQLHNNPSHSLTSTSALSSLFATYQAARLKKSKYATRFSGAASRSNTMARGAEAEAHLRDVVQKMNASVVDTYVGMVRTAPKLDWVPVSVGEGWERSGDSRL